MRALYIWIALGTLSAGAFAETPRGTAPRTTASAYPAHTAHEGTTIGATLLSDTQVRSTFATELSRGYVVVEVAIYPEPGQEAEVLHDNFVLRMDQARTRPDDPRQIASRLQKKGSGGRSVDIYPQVGIGYESGTIHDPVTGTPRRVSGTHTSVGMGVGVGPPNPGPSDADRRTMEQELTEKGLAEGKTAKPVSGYLYFLLPDKKRNATYQIEYTRNGKTSLLRLAPERGTR